ncbi:MAG: HAD-IA family hydrolase [Acidobacteria bacterium]|nr:HAD-IA family hydrolase [Acidobacteriota bacterium]
MNIRIPDRVVVFDYGEVISVSQSEADRAALVAISGLPNDQFWELYDRYREDLDQGLTLPGQYWSMIAHAAGVEWGPAHRQRLWAADIRSWISVEPGTVELLAALHAGGTRVALLSNAGFDFSDPFRHSPMAEFFEAMFVSAEMGLIKPDPEIYRVAARELGIPLDRMVFIDNKKINVDAAVALGVTGHVFTTVAELRTFLESLSE